MTAMSTTAVTYVLYLAISIALTLWVGRTLYNNGFLFLVDVFRGNEALAHSVNHLLVVGFYLVNFGFVSLHLRLGTGMEGATVIEVADHGPGIAPGEREAVFQRFHRADRSRGTEGNGLGLALVRAIAELHGFTIAVADAAPGCIMRLTAPVAQEKPCRDTAHEQAV